MSREPKGILGDYLYAEHQQPVEQSMSRLPSKVIPQFIGVIIVTRSFFWRERSTKH